MSCVCYREWNGDYVTDFRSLLPEGDKYEPLPDVLQVETDVSLVSGRMRSIGVTAEQLSAGDRQVSVRNTSTTLATISSTAKTAGKRCNNLEKSLVDVQPYLSLFHLNYVELIVIHSRYLDALS